VTLCLGIYQEDEPDRKDGQVVRYKSGQKKGQIKTHKVTKTDLSRIDLRTEELQLNRYRIFFESTGFGISRIQLQVLVRDGGTWIAKNRSIEKNIYIIPIKHLNNLNVLNYYDELRHEVDEAFRTGRVRKCNDWESWSGRRCDGYCEVAEACKAMKPNKL